MIKLAIIVPNSIYFDILKRIVKEEFPSIQPTFSHYEDYKDIITDLDIK